MRSLLLIFCLVCLGKSFSQSPFITTWKTDNPGISEDNQITIPTFPGETYDYTVDWGDGNVETNFTGDAIHTYENPGTYKVAISGLFPMIYSYKRIDNLKLLSIDQWGSNPWKSMQSAFLECENMDIIATDIPDFRNVLNFSTMFLDCKSLVGNDSMGLWDVSNVNSMFVMFAGAELFNIDISNWDVSQVRDMSLSFYEAKSFNQPIGKWNVTNVTNMSSMFHSAENFDQELNDWDVSNVLFMGSMFRNAKTFNKDISNWNVSKVSDMKSMFSRAENFNQNIGNWDVSNVESMEFMFERAAKFNGNIGTWNVSRVQNMKAMFMYSDFNQNISNWEVINVNDMDYMFYASQKFNQNISDWNVSNVETMSHMFGNTSLFDQNIGLWNITKVKDMSFMFSGSKGLSIENYNNILIGWSNNSNLQENVVFDADAYEYCIAENARENLTQNFNWTINDNGKNCVEDQRPFITIWKTDNFGKTDNNQIEIPASKNGVYMYNVDWGDGSFDEGIRSAIIHTYDTPGIYEVKISGYFPFTGYGDYDGPGVVPVDIKDREKLIEIKQWGDIRWSSLSSAFAYCKNLDITAVDAPNISNVTMSTNTFIDCISLVGNESLKLWNVGNIKRFDHMFQGCVLFDQDISTWDMKNAEFLYSMFQGCQSFNQDISDWDVSSTKYFSGMFSYTNSFNQDISNWNVSNAIDMSGMFSGAASFDYNLSNWNISNVTDLSGMFNYSGLSNINYDKTIIGWSNLPTLQNNVLFDGGDSQYCESEEARQYLMDTYGWTITDGGKDALCNQDNDLDGILDHKDNCLNTVPNATVNENGCEIIPRDAILVYGLMPTCPGTTNGSIQVSSSLTNRSYNISLDGPTTITENNVSLSQPYIINNLSTGLYSVEISIPEASYTQSFGIQINEVGSISGKRENLDLKSKSVSYSVQGSHSYKVNINNKETLFNFDSAGPNQIQLNDLNGFNTISISGESDCQGLIEDSFNFSDSVVMYPVNTKDKTFIEGYDEESEVQIFDISGRLLFQKKLQNDKLESIDLESYDSGIYPVKIISSKNTQTFKIIKQ